MNKAHLAFNEQNPRNVRQLSTAVREIDWPAAEGLPVSELVQLYTDIENGLQETGGKVVQFVSITPGMGGEIIALDMAWAAAAVLGRDILVVNATGTCGELSYVAPPQSELRPAEDAPAFSLDRHLLKVNGYGLYMVDVNEISPNRHAFAMAEDIIGSLRKLTSLFDMILIAAPPAEVEPFAPIFARHADGNVLIVEAERTSRASTLQMRHILARSGKPLLGAIFNNRNTHVPSWISRWLRVE
jgi:Mrp family chromosome partitioning ATPase